MMSVLSPSSSEKGTVMSDRGTSSLSSHDRLPFYGRRQGRSLRGLKRTLFETLLPSLQISPETLEAFFTLGTSFALEVGFGGGENLAVRAQRDSGTVFLGVEVFKNGVASLLKYIHCHSLSNIRIFSGDVRLLFPLMPRGLFKEIYVLFPDPWPKKRHANRRLLSRDTLLLFAHWLRADGHLIIASDDRDYIEEIHGHLQKISLFSPIPQDTSVWQRQPHDWVTTRYEQKALDRGESPFYLMLQRVEDRGDVMKDSHR